MHFVAHCLSSIILSPLDSNVKRSPRETGDIHVESEGTTASECHQRLHTPAAAGQALANSLGPSGKLLCVWPAPNTPVSTIITSAKTQPGSKACTSAAKPSAACCAAKESAPRANAASMLIASAVCAAVLRTPSNESAPRFLLTGTGWRISPTNPAAMRFTCSPSGPR